MSTVLLRVCHFFKKCIIKYFKKIDVSKLFLSFLFFFFLFFLIFFLILVFSLFFQFFFLFLSPSSVYPVCVQPAVDIIPGTGFSFPGSSRATWRIPGWKKGPAKCWSASYWEYSKHRPDPLHISESHIDSYKIMDWCDKTSSQWDFACILVWFGSAQPSPRQIRPVHINSKQKVNALKLHIYTNYIFSRQAAG